MASTIQVETAAQGPLGIKDGLGRSERLPRQPTTKPPPTKVEKKPGRRFGGVGIVGAVIILALAVGLGARLSVSAHAGSEQTEPTQAASLGPPVIGTEKPVWIDIAKPFQMFDLDSAEFGGLPLTYRARRQSTGLGRQDFLSYGSLGAETPSLDLSITRLGTARPPVPIFFVEMARLAADKGLAVLRSGLPAAVQTRFGAFSIADLSLARGGTTYACLGFRLDRNGSAAHPVDMAGLACGIGAKAMDRDTLACVLDGIGLVSAGDDSALSDFFADAERRGNPPCANSRLPAAEMPHIEPENPTTVARPSRHRPKISSALTNLLQSSESFGSARRPR